MQLDKNNMKNIVERLYDGTKIFPSKVRDPKISLADMSGHNVVLYGLGECSHWFHEVAIKRFNLTPICALDKSPTSMTWFGVRALTAEAFATESDIELTDCYVVVAVGSRIVFEDIQLYLSKIGFSKIFFLHDFYEFHNFFMRDRLEVAHRMKNNIEAFKYALSRLSDHQSEEILCRMIQVHITTEPLDIPCSPRHEQYFPSDFNHAINYENYVCCGAYNGEVVYQVKAAEVKVNNLVCFEPEVEIYKELAITARREAGKVADTIFCFQNAVSDNSNINPFISGDGLGSRLDPLGDSLVQCTKLDDALSGFSPTFITMDIEGAELAAIKGAKKIIRENKPSLAVCVYHYPEQVADIIDQISKLNSDYHFFIRNYTGFLTETVLYAVLPDNIHLEQA